MKLSALVIGVGALEGLGAALSQKISQHGYHVYIVGRTKDKIDAVVSSILETGASASSFCLDATNESQVINLFNNVFEPSNNISPPSLVIYNVGNNKKINFLELTLNEIEEFWQLGCLGGFLVGREAIKKMLPFNHGTIIFTGASASLRGKPGFAHFSSAKAGLRMLSQAMAKEFGPSGIHIAHVVIDGIIDGEKLRSAYPDLKHNIDHFLNINSIAESYWQLHIQDKSAWTHELDLRPYSEDF